MSVVWFLRRSWKLPAVVLAGMSTAAATLALFTPTARRDDARPVVIEVATPSPPPPSPLPIVSAEPSCTLPPAPPSPAWDGWPALAGITRVDATHVTITGALVDRVLADPMASLRGVRLVPAMAKGQPIGFKLYALRPSSLLVALGFRNGDTLRAINGLPLSTADQALVAYTRLRASDRLDVELLRLGRPLTLHFQIVD